MEELGTREPTLFGLYSVRPMPRLCIGIRFTRERRACRAGRMTTAAAAIPNCPMMIVM